MSVDLWGYDQKTSRSSPRIRSRGYTEVTIVYTPADGGASVKVTKRVRLVLR